MKTISIIAILLILPFPLASAMKNPYIADVTCNLTNIAPYYDCSELLLILVFDQRHPPVFNFTSELFYEQPEDEDKALAFAYYNFPIPQDPVWEGADKYFKYFNMIILGDTYNTPDAGRYDEGGMTPFQHEIKHIKCKCGFHP